MSKYYRSVLNVLSPSFSNVYSMDFDGVDDYIDSGDSDTFSFGDGSTDSPFTFSAWVKLDSLASRRAIISKDTLTATTREYALYVSTAGKVSIFIKDQGGYRQQSIDSTTVLNTGQWYHIAATYNGVGGNNAADGLTLYVNGSVETPTNIVKQTPYVAMSNTTAPFRIGKYGTSHLVSGLVDEVAVFDSELSSSNISAIYNSGVPADLSSYSPIAWYRMGENGSWKSTQWLLPENSNKDKVSNYSFEFDGVDDYINCGTDSSLKPTSNYSVSGWFKLDDVTGTKTIISNDNNNGYMVWVNGSRLWFYHYDTGWKTLQSNTVLSADTWYHFCITWELSTTTGRLYINGSEDINSTSFNQVTYLSTPVYIGTYAPSKYFEGYLDEIAVFNTTLSSSDVTSIYNSGTPTTITGAVAHWRMGENATFSTNWTVPDQVGSNDGTSANMTIEDRVGESPNSSNNSLSYNMDEADRETDVPS